jgi:hypothetical protein
LRRSQCCACRSVKARRHGRVPSSRASQVEASSRRASATLRARTTSRSPTIASAAAGRSRRTRRLTALARTGDVGHDLGAPVEKVGGGLTRLRDRVGVPAMRSCVWARGAPGCGRHASCARDVRRYREAA